MSTLPLDFLAVDVLGCGTRAAFTHQQGRVGMTSASVCSPVEEKSNALFSCDFQPERRIPVNPSEKEANL